MRSQTANTFEQYYSKDLLLTQISDAIGDRENCRQLDYHQHKNLLLLKRMGRRKDPNSPLQAQGRLGGSLYQLS